MDHEPISITPVNEETIDNTQPSQPQNTDADIPSSMRSETKTNFLGSSSLLAGVGSEDTKQGSEETVAKTKTCDQETIVRQEETTEEVSAPIEKANEEETSPTHDGQTTNNDEQPSNEDRPEVESAETENEAVCSNKLKETSEKDSQVIAPEEGSSETISTPIDSSCSGDGEEENESQSCSNMADSSVGSITEGSESDILKESSNAESPSGVTDYEDDGHPKKFVFLTPQPSEKTLDAHLGSNDTMKTSAEYDSITTGTGHMTCKIIEKDTRKAGVCTDCGAKASKKNFLTRRPRGFCGNLDCDAFLCKSCKNNHPLIPYREDKPVDWKSAKIERFCKKCYMDLNILNFNSHYDIINPEPENFSGTTMVFTHGAGGTRLSFQAHAMAMMQKYGHRCILLDLAGHGSRWEEECTLENCEQNIRDALIHFNIKKKEEQIKNNERTVLVASSWGGYVSYFSLPKLSEYFSAAVFDASVVDMWSKSERLKWGVLSKIVDKTSYYTQLRFIRGRWVAKSNDYLNFHETKLAVGIYGKSNPCGSVDGRNMWEWIPNIQCPCLFINGTDDPDGYCRKTQQRIIDILPQGHKSTVYMYDGGDHLVSNDARYVGRWVEDAAEFAHNTDWVV